MKEHPIIFSAPMIRAILDGRKTQTRRVVKPQPRGEVQYQAFEIVGTQVCPYGSPGDTLWVRETWRPRVSANGTSRGVQYRADDSLNVTEMPSGVFNIPTSCIPLMLWAPSQHAEFKAECDRWRSPIHMPRWASRITLEVVSVRVQRVQDISEADAIAEGAERNVIEGEEATWEPDWGYRTLCTHYPDGCECHPHPTARDWYAEVWDSIHGPGAWERNDWVHAVEFKMKDGAA